MEELKYLLSLYDQGHIIAVALDSALRVLNPPTKELIYLLQLYAQKHISGTALDYVLLRSGMGDAAIPLTTT